MAKWEDAYTDWQSGMKYSQIAEKYGVSESCVKSWAKRYFKPKQKQEKVAPVAEQRPKVATKKTKARGAPKGNRNALKHGLYANIYWDTLSDEERDMLAQLNFEQEENMLKEQIALLSVRERRLMQSINKYKTLKNDGLTLDTVVKRDLKITKGITQESEQETVITTTASIEIVLKLEAELTRVQGKKTKAVEALSRLRLERLKAGGEDVGLEDDGFLQALSAATSDIWQDGKWEDDIIG